MDSTKVFSQAKWSRLLERSMEQIKALATLKGGEYAGDEDRLANFRRNGQALGVSMELVWVVYAGKHWDAIQQYVKDMASGRKRERAEPITGRADDLIVYLLLFKAMCEERGACLPPVGTHKCGWCGMDYQTAADLVAHAQREHHH